MSKVEKSKNSNINMEKHVEELSEDAAETVVSGKKELGVCRDEAGDCWLPL